MSFTVSTVRETGTITYHCASPRFALEKLMDFRRAEYRDIVVCNADAVIVPESALLLLAGAEAEPQRA